MDRLDAWRSAIEQTICDLTRVPYAFGDVELQTVFDRDRDRYLWLNVGWEGSRRTLEVVVYIELRDSKVWIHCDGTQLGIAKELVGLGIPRENIVLAFRHPDLRKYTDFAAA